MKKKVTFLLDPTNLWIETLLKKFKFGYNKKFSYRITKKAKSIRNQDLVFPICYTKILPKKFLGMNNLVLIAHPSKLPKNRGFFAMQYEILKNKNKIFVSLIKAEKKADTGPICLQSYFTLNGTELIDEIRKKQGLCYLKLIKKFLGIYPKISFKKQKGKSNFIKKRNPKDSKLDINKTLRSQLNQLRINDNVLYPSFFYYKKNKYLIKIYKEEKKN